MTSLGYKWGQPLRRRFWYPVRAIRDVFHLFPPTAALVIAVLFAKNGQLHELYFSYLERPRFLPFVFAAVGLAMLSGAIYASHYWLSAIRQNIIFANFVRPNIGINFRRIRTMFGLVWAYLPWAGVAVGLWLAKHELGSRHKQLADALDVLGAKPVAAAPLEESVLIASLLVMIVGLAFIGCLHLVRAKRKLHVAFVVATVALLVFAATIPYFSNPVAIYRALGPLAVLSISILFAFWIVALFAMVTQRSRVPVLTIVAVAAAVGLLLDVSFEDVTFWFGIVCVGIAALAILSRLYSVAGAALLLSVMSLVTSHRDDILARVPVTAAPPASDATVKARFRTWLGEKRRNQDPATAGGKSYPVFIVSAEGGGIYAAIAASLFLARLQDTHPDFADHIFAISAVSGGAIGASVFQAMVRRPHGSTPCSIKGETNRGTGIGMEQKISEMMLDDHFSPIVGSIIPDLVGEKMGRAKALEQSFLRSVARRDPLAACRLDDWYVNHWSPAERTPALVLNTTSSDTAFRVAFAPFRLNKDSDGSLYSFSDEDMPDADVKLMEAAVASARFPLMLPPFTAFTKSKKRWNFVDGGYADASGSATALDLYRALAPVLEEEPYKDGFDLRTIIVANNNHQVDLGEIDGTSFRDTVAPISTVLKVRDGLANQAVARACDYFTRENENCEKAGPDWKLKIVRLEVEEYGLPLGWKISESTFDVVSWLIGRPALCASQRQTEAASADAIDRIIGKIRANSCVLQSVAQVLGQGRQ